MKRKFENTLILLKALEYREDTVKHQWQIVNNMGDYFTDDPLPERYDLIIDAMVSMVSQVTILQVG